jgi:hypothetical protein
MQPDEDDELTEAEEAEIDALLARVWPEIRDEVWLSLPRHMRWVPYRP